MCRSAANLKILNQKKARNKKVPSLVTSWSLHSRMSTRRLKCIKVFSEKGRLSLRSPCDVCWNSEITDPNVTHKHSICNVRYAHLRALMIMLTWAIPCNVDGDNLQANNASANCTSENVSKSSLRLPQTWRNWEIDDKYLTRVEAANVSSSLSTCAWRFGLSCICCSNVESCINLKNNDCHSFCTTSDELLACLVLTPLGLRCVGNFMSSSASSFRLSCSWFESAVTCTGSIDCCKLRGVCNRIWGAGKPEAHETCWPLELARWEMTGAGKPLPVKEGTCPCHEARGTSKEKLGVGAGAGFILQVVLTELTSGSSQLITDHASTVTESSFICRVDASSNCDVCARDWFARRDDGKSGTYKGKDWVLVGHFQDQNRGVCESDDGATTRSRSTLKRVQDKTP